MAFNRRVVLFFFFPLETIKASRLFVSRQEFEPKLRGPFTQLQQAPNVIRARYSEIHRVTRELLQLPTVVMSALRCGFLSSIKSSKFWR